MSLLTSSFSKTWSVWREPFKDVGTCWIVDNTKIYDQSTLFALVTLIQRNVFIKDFLLKSNLLREHNFIVKILWKVCSTFQKYNWFCSSYFKPTLYIKGLETHCYFALECSKKSYFLRKVPFLLISRSDFTEHRSCCFLFWSLFTL